MSMASLLDDADTTIWAFATHPDDERKSLSVADNETLIQCSHRSIDQITCSALAERPDGSPKGPSFDDVGWCSQRSD